MSSIFLIFVLFISKGNLKFFNFSYILVNNFLSSSLILFGFFCCGLICLIYDQIKQYSSLFLIFIKDFFVIFQVILYKFQRVF